tara:strand:+ start:1507 stop:1995 length:489 start_codon:yes stop_codon:yes gene_type:complete
MKIEFLLNHLLEQECLEDLLSIYEKEETIQNRISKNKFRELCETKLKQKLPIKFMEQKKETNKLETRERCCARIWAGHYGSRCPYKRVNNTDYCSNHNKMILRYGKLLFNRYDEERPLLNEKGNKIPWFDLSHLEMIDQIIQKQDKLLQKLINKQRKITPKI